MSIANKILENCSEDYSPSSPVNNPKKVSCIEDLIDRYEGFLGTLRFGLKVHLQRGDSLAWDSFSEKNLYNAVRDFASIIHIHAQDPRNWDQELYDDLTVKAIAKCQDAEQAYKATNKIA